MPINLYLMLLCFGVLSVVSGYFWFCFCFAFFRHSSFFVCLFLNLNSRWSLSRHHVAGSALGVISHTEALRGLHDNLMRAMLCFPTCYR